MNPMYPVDSLAFWMNVVTFVVSTMAFQHACRFRARIPHSGAGWLVVALGYAVVLRVVLVVGFLTDFPAWFTGATRWFSLILYGALAIGISRFLAGATKVQEDLADRHSHLPFGNRLEPVVAPEEESRVRC